MRKVTEKSSCRLHFVVQLRSAVYRLSEFEFIQNPSGNCYHTLGIIVNGQVINYYLKYFVYNGDHSRITRKILMQLCVQLRPGIDIRK